MPPATEPTSALDAWGTSRRSRLFAGPWLVHADLHNHTKLSDGSGDPARTFPALRAAGLDVAAITDHGRWASAFLGLVDAPGWTGIDRRAWALTAELADAANCEGDYVAMRGFEWSHALNGHMNVWGSERFTDALRAPTMTPFWRWLERGGADGIVTFNHPGTGRLRFGHFGYRPALAERLVGLEIFNRTDDYLLHGTDRGLPSPLSEALGAGWRPGLLGVTDEHGDDWGQPEGKGRTGLYVHELTRAGVLEALSARRFFASRVKGLRLDASLNGARMGAAVAHTGGPASVRLDIDRGEAWWGRSLTVQVLRPGTPVPAVAAALEVVVPGPDEPVVAFDVDLDPGDGSWVVVRVCDPAEPDDPRAAGAYAGVGAAIAYTSPFWLSGG
jgi:hypothetical protein